MASAYVCIRDCYVDKVYREGEIVRNSKIVSFAPSGFRELASQVSTETQEQEALRILGYAPNANSNMADPMSLTDLYKQEKPPMQEAFFVNDEESEGEATGVNPLTGETPKPTKTTTKKSTK